jgi:hypothetical protein
VVGRLYIMRLHTLEFFRQCLVAQENEKAGAEAEGREM